MIEAHAAGISPKGLNPLAVRAMAEVGVDISGQPSQSVDAVRHIPFDCVITVCDHAHETCPVFGGSTRVIHAGFDDPPRLAQEAQNDDEAMPHYRRVRDEIRDFVERLDLEFMNDPTNKEFRHGDDSK